MDFDFFNNPDNLMIFFILVPLLGERGWGEVDFEIKVWCVIMASLV
jgi:transcription initiation factor IIF auxiliary subunit